MRENYSNSVLLVMVCLMTFMFGSIIRERHDKSRAEVLVITRTNIVNVTNDCIGVTYLITNYIPRITTNIPILVSLPLVPMRTNTFIGVQYKVEGK